MSTLTPKISPRIHVAGHRGMVGAAIVRALSRHGHHDIVTRTHAALDLSDANAVRAFFESERPDQVYLAAAKVGGIHANNTFPADFIYQNLMIEANVIHEAWRAGVGRLLFLGSSCIYPRLAPQPMAEDALLTGPLEPTNEPYAIAKIAGIKLCESYRRQHGADFRSVMPTNLYGPGDNYHPENSHVIPALIQRFHEAKRDRADKVIVWGSGTPRREFLHVDDLADACVFLMRKPTEYDLVNVGVGEDLEIRELAALVAEIVGYDGEVRYDPSRPDGTPRKLLDLTRMNALGWRASIALRDGITRVYEWFQNQQVVQARA